MTNEMSANNHSYYNSNNFSSLVKSFSLISNMSLIQTQTTKEVSTFPTTHLVLLNAINTNQTEEVDNHLNSTHNDLQERFDWTQDMWFRHSASVSIVLCMAYTIVFISGIVGNCFVVAVVVRTPRMRTVTNFFIVNLACADILVLLFCLPATLISNLLIRKL